MLRLTHTKHMGEEMKVCISKQPKDCALVCQDGVVEAHRIALCWASPYLLRMLTHNKTGRVILPQFDVEDIRLLVQLIYGREIMVPASKVDHLVDCARQLDICAFQ